MRKLVLLGLVLTAFLTLLVMGAYAIPVREAVPTILNDLRLTDCVLPCWARIVPGQTTMDNAYQQLMQAFPETTRAMLNRSENQISMSASFENLGNIVVQLLPDSFTPPRVETIRLIPVRTPELILSQLLNVDGAPACIMGQTAIYSTRQAVAIINLVLMSPGESFADVPVRYVEIRSRRSIQPDPSEMDLCQRSRRMLTLH